MLHQDAQDTRHFRHALAQDFDAVQNIYAHAREVMKQHGNGSQWGDMYPLTSQVLHDIASHRLMLLVDYASPDGSERILGVCAVCKGPDPTYATIRGAWLDDDDYIALHRVASSGIAKHTGADMLNWAVRKYLNVRGDTHENNAAMQHIFESAGFTRCGIINLPERKIGTSERIAFQRHIESHQSAEIR